MSFNIEIGILD